MWRKHGNRVQQTRFPCTETEFNELDFHVWKTSSMNSSSIHGKRSCTPQEIDLPRTS